MKVLVINAGSSSFKYQLRDLSSNTVLCSGLVERIGEPMGRMVHKIAPDSEAEEKLVTDRPFQTHVEGMKAVVALITDPEKGVIKSKDEINAIGHRVLMGGQDLTHSVIVDQKIKDIIREWFPLSPLHNPANLAGIEVAEELFPGVPNVAVFDTEFHATMPEKAFMYPLPYELYEKYHIRRYGFHGTSHRYVSEKAVEYLGRGAAGTKIVTCHLGNGSSISAVKDGKVIDTSMGFTPLEGIIMGSRCGSIDPAIVPFIMEKENIPASEMGNFMNKQCGLLGVSEVSSDLRDVMAAVRAGNKQAQLAFDILCYGIKKYIGSYAAAMNGLDCVVFTAGIGENTPEVRAGALAEMDYLGIRVDPEKNANVKKLPAPCDISADGSRVRVYVIPTNEELVIASDTEKLVSAL